MKDLSNVVFYARCFSAKQADRDITVEQYKSRVINFGFKPEQFTLMLVPDYQLILDKVSKGLITSIYLQKLIVDYLT